MRKAGVLAVAGLMAVGGLSACSDGSTPAGSATSSGAATSADGARTVEVEGQKVTIEGEPGAAPILRFDKPLSITKQQLYPVSKGTSPDKLKDGQLLTVNVDAVSPESGTDLRNTWSSNQPQPMIMNASAIGNLYEAFKDGAVYAQALGAVSADSSTGQPAALVYYEVDGAQDIPSRASGTAVKEPAGLPKVTLDKDGKPSIAPVSGKAPTDLKTAVLIEGSGDFVDEGDGLAVQYTGWLWDGKQFDSSWDRGLPATFSLVKGQLIDGWVQGLAKKKVGSQVLLVIPPSLAYGDQENGDIPANSTLVFVIDILGRVTGR